MIRSSGVSGRSPRFRYHWGTPLPARVNRSKRQKPILPSLLTSANELSNSASRVWARLISVLSMFISMKLEMFPSMS